MWPILVQSIRGKVWVWCLSVTVCSIQIRPDLMMERQILFVSFRRMGGGGMTARPRLSLFVSRTIFPPPLPFFIKALMCKATWYPIVFSYEAWRICLRKWKSKQGPRWSPWLGMWGTKVDTKWLISAVFRNDPGWGLNVKEDLCGQMAVLPCLFLRPFLCWV